MPTKPSKYTDVPRATLWLLRGDEFTMGDADHGPTFDVEVGPFYIGKGPITNLQYEAFDPGHVRQPTSPHDDGPATGMSWDQAMEYCDWYAQLSGKPFRLPTEVEWEFAARGGTLDRLPFPKQDAANFAWSKENSEGCCPVIEELKANPAGLHDMLGLVWEWTTSQHLPYPAQDGDERDSRTADGPRVVRGGCFLDPVPTLSVAKRRPQDPKIGLPEIGFRIVRSL